MTSCNRKSETPLSPLLHEASSFLLCRSSHGHAIDLNRRNPYAYRYRLSVLAAGADAFVESQIVTDHRDASQHVGPIADQRSTFDRCRDLAISNQIGFRGREHQFPIGDIHLPTAEVHSIDAVLHRADDVL